MVVRRIGVLSLAKFLGGIYCALGLVLGGIISVFALAGAAIGGTQSQEPAAAVIGAFMGVGAIVVLPILYGVMGFLFGLFTGFLYNLFAGIFGGIELDVDMRTPPPAPMTAAAQASPFS